MRFYPLRAGGAVLDRRLGAILVEDERNSEFPVAPLLAAAPVVPPPREWPVRLILNQGREGSCCGMALTHELLAEPEPWTFPVPGLTPRRLTKRAETVQAQRFAVSLYHQAQRVDEWPGGAYPGARPRMEGTSVGAAMKVMRRVGAIAEYRWAATGLEAAVAVCQLGPVVIGVPWYTGMLNPTGARLRVRGVAAGGHAVALTGADIEIGVVTVTNSWGRQWGRDGQALLDIDDLDRLLRENGHAAIPLTRAPSPPGGGVEITR